MLKHNEYTLVARKAQQHLVDVFAGWSCLTVWDKHRLVFKPKLYILVFMLQKHFVKLSSDVLGHTERLFRLKSEAGAGTKNC